MIVSFCFMTHTTILEPYSFYSYSNTDWPSFFLALPYAFLVIDTLLNPIGFVIVTWSADVQFLLFYIFISHAIYFRSDHYSVGRTFCISMLIQKTWTVISEENVFNHSLQLSRVLSPVSDKERFLPFFRSFPIMAPSVVTNTTERSTQICSLVFDLLFSWLQLYACIIFAY